MVQTMRVPPAANQPLRLLPHHTSDERLSSWGGMHAKKAERKIQMKFIGAILDNGIIYCETCGAKVTRKELITTDVSEKGTAYVYKCRKCKKRIEVLNPKSKVD